MNSITFDGRVVADSELKYTQGGDAVLSFRVASDIGFGEKKTTNWFGCQVWGKRAEALLPYLIKGQQVTVYGQLTLREWTDRDGIKRLSPDVRINEVSMQGGKRDDAQQPADSNKPPRQPARSSYGGQKHAASKGEYPY
ncbi:single-stranded DNA-binding protein [Aquitalea sp. S1-19]|nr:single-stranded DNA-binding protein [Aquitalea sp. S1-19]